MTLTIDIAPELEDEIRQAAKREGLSPDKYILKSVLSRLRESGSAQFSYLPEHESDLLQRINQSMAHIDWSRYKILVRKRESETLLADEQMELIAIGEQLETANGNRIELLIELARLRETTLPEIMQDLGITPFDHA